MCDNNKKELNYLKKKIDILEDNMTNLQNLLSHHDDNHPGSEKMDVASNERDSVEWEYKDPEKPININFKCSKCEAKFTPCNQLKSHLTFPHVSKIFSRLNCDRKFQSNNDLEIHISTN